MSLEESSVVAGTTVRARSLSVDVDTSVDEVEECTSVRVRCSVRGSFHQRNRRFK